LKRVREIKDLSATRLREGDSILLAARGSTKASMALFSNQGSCYVLRINDVPASTGYGEPIQKLFNLRDGERIVGGTVLTPTAAPAGALAVAVSKRGFGLRFNLDPHRELSTRVGRRFAKFVEGDEIVGVAIAGGDEIITVVSAEARALICKVAELPELTGPGRGVTLIKLEDDDSLLAFAVSAKPTRGAKSEDDPMIAETEGGKKIPVGPGRYSVTGRGGKGHALGRKIKITRVILPEPTLPAPQSTLLN